MIPAIPAVVAASAAAGPSSSFTSKKHLILPVFSPAATKPFASSSHEITRSLTPNTVVDGTALCVHLTYTLAALVGIVTAQEAKCTQSVCKFPSVLPRTYTPHCLLAAFRLRCFLLRLVSQANLRASRCHFRFTFRRNPNCRCIRKRFHDRLSFRRAHQQQRCRQCIRRGSCLRYDAQRVFRLQRFPVVRVDDVSRGRNSQQARSAFVPMSTRCSHSASLVDRRDSTDPASALPRRFVSVARPFRKSCFVQHQPARSRSHSSAESPPRGPPRTLFQSSPHRSSCTVNGIPRWSGGISSIFSYPTHSRSFCSSASVGTRSPRIAAFHKSTSGPTVISNFPSDTFEYRTDSSITRYKSAGDFYRTIVRVSIQPA